MCPGPIRNTQFTFFLYNLIFFSPSLLHGFVFVHICVCVCVCVCVSKAIKFSTYISILHQCIFFYFLLFYSIQSYPLILTCVSVHLCVCCVGTTGPPKAVMISHDNVTWTARVSAYLAPIAYTVTWSFIDLFVDWSVNSMIDSIFD